MKEQLMRYNMEDCYALKVVSDFIELINTQLVAGPNASDVFSHTDYIETDAGSRGKFHVQEFALKDFDFVNQCSYFDYQRDKMLARDIRKRKPKSGPPGQKNVPRPHKNNKIVDVYASKCPMCQSKKLSSERPVRRQIIDLKFSGAAVRRWVVLYLSREYRCKKCGAKFIPDGFPKIRSKFGKGLVIWRAYQMVIGGQNMSQIPNRACDAVWD